MRSNKQLGVFACFLAIFAVAQKASALDQWLCVTESSKMQGSTILACGVANGKDEDEARSKAFEAAKAEFARLCSASDECRDRAYSLEPRRTTCDRDGSLWKCYREIAYSINAQAPGHDGKAAAHPKIKKGMSKKEVLAQLGVPASTFQADSLQFWYTSDKICLKGRYGCGVYFENEKLKSWDDVQPLLTDELD